jgi:alanine-glyoxylate transaminase/(R)-3-amino-2-methylpropionate-pyruvate transaminase
LQNSYHGATIGAQSLSGISGFRHHIPLLTGIHHVANPDSYRGTFGGDTAAYLADIDRTIKYSTSGRLAGMIVEPILGYGGIVEVLEGYLKSASEKVRAHGGVMIVDEVQSGFGRTGYNFWAFEHHGIIPDIVVMAKGIGNGFPLGAVVAQRHVAESLAGKFTFHTYGASPTSCAAGRAVLQVIDKEGLQENSRKVGASLHKVFDKLQQKHEIIGNVRGRGLMLSIELVKDRKSKVPAPDEAAAIFEKTRDNGLVLSKSGANRNIFRFVPPMCIAEDDVAQVEDALERSFAGY